MIRMATFPVGMRHSQGTDGRRLLPTGHYSSFTSVNLDHSVGNRTETETETENMRVFPAGKSSPNASVESPPSGVRR